MTYHMSKFCLLGGHFAPNHEHRSSIRQPDRSRGRLLSPGSWQLSGYLTKLPGCRIFDTAPCRISWIVPVVATWNIRSKKSADDDLHYDLFHITDTVISSFFPARFGTDVSSSHYSGWSILPA